MGYSLFRKTGLVHYDEAKACAGYTVFTQIYGDHVYMIDMSGRVVHKWTPPAGLQTYHGDLLENGNFLMLAVDEKAEYRPGGVTTALEMTWSGEVVWRYDNPMLHHGLVRRKNGNTLVTEWAPVPTEIAEAVRRDARPGDYDPKLPMLCDVVRELTPDMKTVWQFEIYKALDPETDRTCTLHKYKEWTHTNAIFENDAGDVIFTMRYIDSVAILDRAAGRFKWKWGPGVIGHAHDAHWLPNGNLLIFDNEYHFPTNLDHSRIIEVDPNDKKIVWTYTSDPRSSFSSGHLGSSQQLSNGNVLVCEGSSGRLFEVTRSGETVWEYSNPYFMPYRYDKKSPRVYKTRRYSADYANLRDRLR
jgi:hypothetical protein